MPLHPSLKKPIIEMEKSSLRGTKPLLQFYAPRLSLEAKHNLAKRYKNCARGKTKNHRCPAIQAHTSSIIFIPNWPSLGQVKKNMLKPPFSQPYFSSPKRRKAVSGIIVNIFSGFYIAGKANLMYNIVEK